jgi:hypothetical protein
MNLLERTERIDGEVVEWKKEAAIFSDTNEKIFKNKKSLSKKK